MLYGWLVYNQYMKSPKFSEIYALLQESAKKHDINLKQVGHAEIVLDINQNKIVFPDVDNPDFILFWDKDVLLARSLEKIGIRLFNSAEAIELCDDKSKTCIQLASCGVHQPKTFTAPFTFPHIERDNDYFEKVSNILGFPLVLKECYGSFGDQVYLVNSIDELTKKIKDLGDKGFILQEYVENSFGRDIRVSVVGEQVVASVLRQSVSGDFRSNLTLGGTASAYEMNYAQEQLAIDAVKALNLDFAGVDVLFGENNTPMICEVNSNVHFKTTLDCTGINLADYIMQHIIDILK